ncbi:MAG: hypothetical protein ACLPT4_00985 [Verrucomicrobiia bacterium]
MLIFSCSLTVSFFGVAQPVVDYALGKGGSQGVHGSADCGGNSQELRFEAVGAFGLRNGKGGSRIGAIQWL